MSDTARSGIALFGCGNWGSNHVRVWADLGVLRVVCDADAERLAKVAAEHPDIRTVTSPAEALADDAVAAAVIATPAVTHADLAVQAIEAGKHVFIEKPMAISVAEAQRVADAADRGRRVLMVNHVLEYHPAVLALRDLITQGELGKVLYLYSNRLNLGRVRTEENALWSFAPHDAALMLRLVGSAPTQVSCTGEAYLSRGVADVTLMSLSFPGNVQGHVFVSWLHPFKEHRFVVVGDKQMAVFDDTAPWSEKLVLYPHRVDWVDGRVPVARRAEGAAVPLQEGEPLRAACEHFLEAIRTDSRPLTDSVSALAVMTVLEAADTSLRDRGTPVVIAPTANDAVHPMAIVDDGAELGEGTRVWHFSHVMSGARIGRDCSLGQNVFVAANVRIGDRVRIQNNVSVYEGVELEDGVFCGPSVVFTNVINPRAEVSRKDEYRRTVVRQGASLGANCTIVCGVDIGRYAFVGAGAVVTSDVPDHALVVGVPARVVGAMCRCGERLPESDDAATATCSACGRSYTRTPEGGAQETP